MGILDEVFKSGRGSDITGSTGIELSNELGSTKIYVKGEYDGAYYENNGLVTRYDKLGNIIGNGYAQSDGSVKFYDKQGYLEYSVENDGYKTIYKDKYGMETASIDNQNKFNDYAGLYCDDDDFDDELEECLDKYYKEEMRLARNFKYPDSEYK